MDPADQPPPEAPAPKPGSGALRSFFGLFLVPLLVVLVCVGVFVGFGWIAYDRHTTSDYLNDLRSSWRPRRAQAAYELSKILVADPRALDDEPGARAEVRSLFQQAEDGSIRRYLALILGYTRDEESVPMLLDALDDPESETRIYALWALGAIGDRRAADALLAALSDGDPGIRKTAAYALGELPEPAAVPALTGLLGDSVADVRWNAALALARLGSDAGVPVLRQMLDRGLTGQVPGIRPDQQEEAMLGAIPAVARAGGEGGRELLEELARSDPSLKVRQAARDALEAARAP